MLNTSGVPSLLWCAFDCPSQIVTAVNISTQRLGSDGLLANASQFKSAKNA